MFLWHILLDVYSLIGTGLIYSLILLCIEEIEKGTLEIQSHLYNNYLENDAITVTKDRIWSEHMEREKIAIIFYCNFLITPSVVFIDKTGLKNCLQLKIKLINVHVFETWTVL